MIHQATTTTTATISAGATVAVVPDKATPEDFPSSSPPRSVRVSASPSDSESESESEDMITLLLQEDPISISSPALLPLSLTTNVSVSEEEEEEEEEKKTLDEQQQEQEQKAATTTAIVATLLEEVVVAVAATVEQERKQQQEEEDSQLLKEEEVLLCQLLSKGLSQLSYTERCAIQEEIHGVHSMGLMEEEEEEEEGVVVVDNEATISQEKGEAQQEQQETATLSTTTVAVTTTTTNRRKKDSPQHFIRTKLQEFNTLSSASSSSSTLSTSAAASDSLKLMCLRAELWDVPQASARFLRHLQLLSEYYGAEALEHALTLQRFFSCHKENNNNNHNGSNNSNSSDGTATVTATTKQKNDTNNAPSPPRKKRKYKKRAGSVTTVTTTVAGAGAGVNSSTTKTIPNNDQPPKKKNRKNPATTTESSTNINTNNIINHSVSTEHMSWLKQGGFQLLPSRDRAGRRVVILHGVSHHEEEQPNLNRQLHIRNLCKALFYFFTTIAKCDVEAQRDGLVLIVSTSTAASFFDCTTTATATTTATTNENNDATATTTTSTAATTTAASSSHASAFFEQLYELYRALPIRCTSVHLCYDIQQDPHLSKLLRVRMLERFGPDFAQRVRVYQQDACHRHTQQQLATYGIPVLEIPLTESGTLKLKQHYRWIKMQDFFEKQEREALAQEEKEALAIAQQAAALQVAVTAVNQQQQRAAAQQVVTMTMHGCTPPPGMGLYGMYQQQQQQQCSYYSFQQQQQQQTQQHVVLPQQVVMQQQQQATSLPQPMVDTSTSTTKNNHHHDYVEVTVIECPRVNDVLFIQGGKFWNDHNKFQSGNLEFMEIIGAKITAYQETRSWKKKHKVLLTALTDFVTFTQGKGRFLTNATAQLQPLFQHETTTPPEGCWMELPLTSPLLMQKVRTLLMNHIRRLEKASLFVPSSSFSFSQKSNYHRGLKQPTRVAEEKKVLNKRKKRKSKNRGLKQAREEEKKVIKKRKSVSFSPPPPPPPIQPCLLTTTGKNTLFSIFDNDISDHENYLNIDIIDVDTIQNNGDHDKNNDDIDIDDNGDTNNGESTTCLHHHQVVHAILATDDSLNCEANELLMHSFVW